MKHRKVLRDSKLSNILLELIVAMRQVGPAGIQLDIKGLADTPVQVEDGSNDKNQHPCYGATGRDQRDSKLAG